MNQMLYIPPGRYLNVNKIVSITRWKGDEEKGRYYSIIVGKNTEYKYYEYDEDGTVNDGWAAISKYSDRYSVRLPD